MDHPSLGVIRNHCLPWLVRNVLHACLSPHLESFFNPLQYTLPRHLQSAGDLANRLASGIMPQDLSALYVAEGGGKLLIAVSGGLDSMTLLHALEKLSAKHRWQLVVAHFNHRLRGR